MKRVIIIANDFAKRMCIEAIPLKYETLCSIAENNRWKILTYSEGISIINSFSLKEHCENNNGFVYRNEKCTIIFIKDDLKYLEKIHVICHEIGHIVLGHTTFASKQKDGAIYNNNSELEAEAFALELQAPEYLTQLLKVKCSNDLVNMGIFSNEKAKEYFALHKNKKYKSPIKLFLTVAVLFLLMCVPAIMVLNVSNNLKRNNNYTYQPTKIISEETTDVIESTFDEAGEIIVYVTHSGEKYHTADCRYIEGKKVLSCTLPEAEERGYAPCLVCKPTKEKATDSANIHSQ